MQAAPRSSSQLSLLLASGALRGIDPERVEQFRVEVTLADDGKIPTEFRLFAAGENRTTKGTYRFDEVSCVSVKQHAEEWGNDFMVDYGHASLGVFVVDPAEAGKAAGWFKAEVREGALYATNVRWTEPAAAKLRAKEFRYVSPAAEWERLDDDSRRITRLINCALENNPATYNAQPLVASARAASTAVPQESPMLKVILARLGLAEGASEQEVLAALTRLQDRAGKVDKREEQHRQLLQLSGKEGFSEALGVFQGWKVAGDQAQARITELTAKVGELEKASQGREIDELIATAKRDGKLPPAAEKAARDIAAKPEGVVSLKAFLDVLPKVGTRVEEPKPDDGKDKGGGADVVTLDAHEKKQVESIATTANRPFADVEKEYLDRKKHLLAKHGIRRAG